MSDPNLQNIPIRREDVPRKPFCPRVEPPKVDYSKIEQRLLEIADAQH